MIDNDQITALAREYAEEATKADASDPNLSATDLNGIKHDVAEYAEEVISFLLRRFCLVEKARVEEKLKAVNNQIKSGEELGLNRLTAVGHTNKALLSVLFPEIAKEVEG